MFCSAFSVGTRLNDWKTKPIFSRRSRVSRLSSRPVISCPPMRMEPALGESRPARQCISVDLPEPEGPMIAVKRPAPNSTSTPRRASTRVEPLPYALVRPLAATASVPVCCSLVIVMQTTLCIRAADRVTRTAPFARPHVIPGYDVG